MFCIHLVICNVIQCVRSPSVIPFHTKCWNLNDWCCCLHYFFFRSDAGRAFYANSNGCVYASYMYIYGSTVGRLATSNSSVRDHFRQSYKIISLSFSTQKSLAHTLTHPGFHNFIYMFFTFLAFVYSTLFAMFALFCHSSKAM